MSSPITSAPSVARRRSTIPGITWRFWRASPALRDGTAKAGEVTRTATVWRRIPSGDIVAAAIIEANMRPDSPARITIEHGGREQCVRLRAAPRHFSGVQWYFLCPDTGRRVSVLWKPPGARYFASRQAFGRQVACGSQFQTPRDRALSAAQMIRHRLGGNEWLSGLNGFPPKPKGMRWRTFERHANATPINILRSRAFGSI